MNYNIFSDLPRIAAALMCEPWLIVPEHHRSMVDQIAAHRSQPQGARHSDRSWDRSDPPEGYINRITSYDKASGIGMIDIKGVIGKGLSQMAMDCGGFDLNLVDEGLSKLAALKPSAVQLYLNTPGGSVTGVEETAAAIEEFAGTTAPVHAYVDSMCCSAGEWLASGATSLMAAPSAVLGSIGVYSAMVDSSEHYRKEGFQVHLLASAPDKGAGYPGTVVTQGQLDAARAQVMEIAEDFFSQMARRQPAGRAALVKDIHFSGRTFRAKSAEGAALHDGLLRDRASHLGALVRTHGRTSKSAAR